MATAQHIRDTKQLAETVTDANGDQGAVPAMTLVDASGTAADALPVSDTASYTAKSSSAASQELLAANSTRKGWSIWNDDTGDTLYLKFVASGNATTTNYHWPLPSNTGVSSRDFGVLYTGRIVGIWGASQGSGSARIAEFT